MYRASDNTAYSLTEQGQKLFGKYKDSLILCERGIALYDRNEEGAMPYFNYIEPN